MNKLRKNKKQTTIIIIIFSIISLIFLSTIAYSAFSSTMNITGIAHARVEADVRITDFSIKDTTNNSISMYENFTKNTTSSSIKLQQNSSITYNLEITNYGSTNVGIFDITGLPSELNYSIENYNLKDMICDDTGKCNSFAKKNYSLKIYTTTSSYEGDIILKFDFRIFHNVSYVNFNGTYQKNIIDGDTVNINLSYDSPKMVLVTSDNYIKHNYTNNILYLENVTCDLKIEGVNTTNYNFDYTGNVQEFTVPYDGTYRFNAWGAQGGSYDIYYGGYGAYTTGEMYLTKGQKIYIFVGGQGSSTNVYNETIDGGYNGGGKSTDYWSTDPTSIEIKQSGGGATHFSFENKFISDTTNLNSLITVASGGSGSAYFYVNSTNVVGHAYCYGSSGGGITGTVNICQNISGPEYLYEYRPSTQTDAGKANHDNFITFGKYGTGGDGYAGGGGGFYGGTGNFMGFGGGSSYIANSKLVNKYMYCYNCETSNELDTKTYSTSNVSSTPIVNYAKQGNGYASIEIIELGKTYQISYSGINGTYQNSIKSGDTLNINFGANAPSNIIVLESENRRTNYSYSDGTLNLKNVRGDLRIASYQYERTFKHVGESQVYVVPLTGTYKIELWGARGGHEGGLGGYTSGTIKLTKGTKLYVYVGGQGFRNPVGKPAHVLGGYNGGGPNEGQTCCSRVFGSGGGATDIRLTNGDWNDFNSLKSRIMVAAGGGGRFMTEDAGQWGASGGAAGGLIGLQGGDTDWCAGLGGTQTLGGSISLEGKNCVVPDCTGYTDPGKVTGTFGIGGKHGNEGNNSTGGGGGYYGGSSSGHIAGAGGGSSFISGHNGCDAITASSIESNIGHSGQSIHYSGYKFTETKMIDGEGYNWTNARESYVGMPTHDGTGTMTGNAGNGYAKITLVKADDVYDFDYTGEVETFTAPYSGKYKLEVWGASGGSLVADGVNVIGNFKGGAGGYSSGEITLTKGEKLYIAVGGAGIGATKREEKLKGGYNGGGSVETPSHVGAHMPGSGGGATHIAKTTNRGELKNYENYKNEILIVAGGGGGARDQYNHVAEARWGHGGAGGGLTGEGAISSYGSTSEYTTISQLGGTQTSGYAFGVGASNKKGQSAGGGGYYGGYGGGNIPSSLWDEGASECYPGSGSGGSGYLSPNLTNSQTITGNNQVPTYDGKSTMAGNMGNGYAKITLIEKN